LLCASSLFFSIFLSKESNQHIGAHRYTLIAEPHTFGRDMKEGNLRETSLIGEILLEKQSHD